MIQREANGIWGGLYSLPEAATPEALEDWVLTRWPAAEPPAWTMPAAQLQPLPSGPAHPLALRPSGQHGGIMEGEPVDLV